MATHMHKNISPGCHEIYHVGRPFLIYNYYNIPNLSDPCPSIDKTRRRNIAFSLCIHVIAQ